MVLETRSSRDAGKIPVSFNTAETEEEAKRIREPRDMSRTPDRRMKARIAEVERSLRSGIPPLPAGSSGTPAEPQPLDMNAKLDWLIGHAALAADVATKADMEVLTTTLNGKLGAIQSDVEVLKTTSATKNEVFDLAERIAKLEIEVTDIREKDPSMDVERDTGTIGSKNRVLIERLEKLEKQLKETASIENSARDLTMVVGGLKDYHNLAEAEAFVRDKLWTHYGPKITEVYTKGDFKGLIFIKFSSKRDRDTATSLFRQQKFKHGENIVWAKEDLPISTRLVQSVVFAAKKAMIGWGYEKTCIWADIEKSSLTIGGTTILTVKLIDDTISMDIPADWKAEILGADGNDDTMTNILAEANIKLKQGGAATKGLGKGKKGKADAAF